MDILRTSRLALRTWRDDDIDEFVRVCADPAVYDYLPGPWTRAKVEALAAAQNVQYERHGTCYFAATLRGTGALLGFIGLKYQDFDRPFTPCFELGWCLGSEHWGQGYASEGALACIAHGFDALGLDEIVSFTVPANLRSRAVMARLGLRHHPEDDFDHPALPPGHRLSRHVLYRIARATRA
jgi:RimJ/RimL family protein N-acetyltransferase